MNQNEVVIKQAKLDSSYVSQHSVRSNGAVIDINGNFIIKEVDGLYKAPPQKNNSFAPDRAKRIKLSQISGVDYPVKHPDAHIPL